VQAVSGCDETIRALSSRASPEGGLSSGEPRPQDSARSEAGDSLPYPVMKMRRDSEERRQRPDGRAERPAGTDGPGTRARPRPPRYTLVIESALPSAMTEEEAKEHCLAALVLIARKGRP
jgi:hypothetical protein